VRIPSVTGDEGTIAGFVESALRERTRPTFLRRHGNAVVVGFGAAEPGVILAGHLDTVPPNENLEPAIDRGDVTGLGATDMKGALAVMLALAERAATREMTPFALVFYDREEGPFERNGLRALFAAEPWLARAGLALMLEPTANAVELGCVGTLHARVTFHGRAAHSARPWLGENAIHKAGPFLTGIAGLPPRELGEGSVVFREVLSATLAEGGSTRNVVPDRFTVNLNFRFAPDRSPEDAVAHVRSLAPAGTTVEIVDLAPAAPARADAPLLRRFIESNALNTRAKQAWTDVAQFAQHGVPAANFGPGLPELAHTREERVPIANLVRAHDALAVLLDGR
jgi:succinyl-diaminopimelate desuccinylase